MDVEVDGKPTTLLFDTGARVSVLLNPIGRDCWLRLVRHMQEKFALVCDSTVPNVGFTAPEREVEFKGFLGADLMSKFSSVRIDYRASVVEFEQ